MLADGRADLQFGSVVEPDERLTWCDRVHIVLSVR
jgi:hypothetical protein